MLWEPRDTQTREFVSLESYSAVSALHMVHVLNKMLRSDLFHFRQNDREEQGDCVVHPLYL